MEIGREEGREGERERRTHLAWSTTLPTHGETRERARIENEKRIGRDALARVLIRFQPLAGVDLCVLPMPHPWSSPCPRPCTSCGGVGVCRTNNTVSEPTTIEWWDKTRQTNDFFVFFFGCFNHPPDFRALLAAQDNSCPLHSIFIILPLMLQMKG